MPEIPDPAEHFPESLRHCPLHPDEGFVWCDDKTETEIVDGAWLSRTPRLLIEYLCGALTMFEQPKQWNEQHRDFRFLRPDRARRLTMRAVLSP